MIFRQQLVQNLLQHCTLLSVGLEQFWIFLSASSGEDIGEVAKDAVLSATNLRFFLQFSV